MKKYIFCVIILLGVWSCQSEKSVQDEVVPPLLTFDFEQALKDFEHSDTTILNDLAKSVRFVKLELTDQSGLSAIHHVQFARWNDHFILSTGINSDFSGILSFDTDGKFEDVLVAKGHGKGELPNGIYDFHLVGDELVIDGGIVRVLNLKEKTMDKIRIDSYCTDLVPISDSLYAVLDDGNSFRFSGKTDEPYMRLYNRSGKLVKAFCYQSPRRIDFNPFEKEGRVYQHDKRLIDVLQKDVSIFKDLYNDTIYRIVGDTIIPLIYLKNGSLSPKYKDLKDPERQSRQVYVSGHGISMSDDYFFLTYFYQQLNGGSVWDIHTGKMVMNVIHNNNGPDGTSAYHNRHFSRYELPDGTRVIVGIVSVENDRLYAVMKSKDAASFLPDVTVDSNPVLMEVMLK